jgi:hypothetical protein
LAADRRRVHRLVTTAADRSACRAAWLCLIQAEACAARVVFGHGRFVAWGTGGLLLQVACSAQRPPRRASRSCREAGGYTQSSQKGKPSVASYRQRRVFYAALGGNSHPIGRQAQGSRFPAWKLSSPPSERRSCGQVQESIVASASRLSCSLRAWPEDHPVMPRRGTSATHQCESDRSLRPQSVNSTLAAGRVSITYRNRSFGLHSCDYNDQENDPAEDEKRWQEADDHSGSDAP